MRRAGPRYPEADVGSTDFSERRGLDRPKVTGPSACGFVGRGTNVVVQGPAGTGKTCLARALAKAVCAKRTRARYVGRPDLEDLWRDSRTRRGGERKLLGKFGGCGLLVLDEWLPNKPGDPFRAMPLELMGLRYGLSSTISCTQYKSKDWHARPGGGVLAEAIMDGIAHGTVWLETGNVNMRDIYG